MVQPKQISHLTPLTLLFHVFNFVLKRVGDHAARQRCNKLHVICPKLLEFIGDALNMVPAFTVAVVVVVLGGLVSLGFSHGSQINKNAWYVLLRNSSPFRDLLLASEGF